MKILTFVLLLAFVQTSLTNKDVVDMLKSGLSPEIVVAKIKSSPNTFDTSPAALKELKGANVPDAVILAMLEGSKPAPESDKRFVPFKEVKRIYVGQMGSSDDSERFRLLLKERLEKKGFAVVDSEKEADAILTGVLATQLSEGTTRARAAVTLKAPNGQTLWADDFGVRRAFGLGRRDSVKLRADDVADGLKDAWKKAQKAQP